MLPLPPRPCPCPCCGDGNVAAQRLHSCLSRHSFGQPPFVLTGPRSCLSHRSCTCPAIHLGSPHLCSPALICACPAVCLGSPHLCSPALVCACHCSFMLAATGWSSCSLLLIHALHLLAGPRSCLAFTHCSLVLILVSLVLHLCLFSFCSRSFGLGCAHLGSPASRLCLYQIYG